MKTSARRTPSFRRGSKRYSITGLATDVAVMLRGKPGLERRSTQFSLAQIDEQNGPPHTEIPRDIPTPARSDATPSSRMSYAGSIRSLESKSEDADDIRAREEMDRINAEIMAEMEAERAGTPAKQTQGPRSLHRTSSMSTSNASIRSSVSLSSASRRSSKLEDSEDMKAREEMALINAEIMAAAAAEQREQRLPTQVYTPPSRPVNSHQRRPTWFDQAKLAVVHGAHGVLKFKKEGADMEIVESPKEIEHPRVQDSARSAEPFLYDGPKHARLPTWVDQATLPTVSGSHGVLKFKKDGADMEIVEVRRSVDEPINPQESLRDQAPFVYDGPKHARLPTWTEQATLPVISGSHGVLKFGEKGACMAGVEPRPESQRFSRHEHLPTWADQSKLDLVSGSWGTLSFRSGGADMLVIEASKHTLHNHILTWADQSTLPVVKGTHCMLSFNDTGADMEVIQPTILPEAAWFGKRNSLTSQPQNKSRAGVAGPYITPNMPGNAEAAEQEIKQKRISIPNGLSSVMMNHGRDNTRSTPENTAESILVAEVGGEKYDPNHPALKEIVQAIDVPTNRDSYRNADQGKLAVVRGSHGSLVFGPIGGVMVAVRKDAYWVDQRTLSIVRGDHGFLSFGSFETVIKARRRDPYWADQRTLALVRGSHGRLAFSSRGTSSLEIIRPDPYWSIDQKTVPLVRGFHGKMAFGPGGASLKVVRPDPYWADQKTLSLVGGSHGTLAFSPSGVSSLKIVRPDPYWSVDQRTLSTVTGSHGGLIFGPYGASLKVIRPDPYWVDQRGLAMIKGSHGRLKFTSNGTSLDIVRPDPYWVDQSALSLIQGSHGSLEFGLDGAVLKAVRPDPYWADQSTLPLVEGSHGRLLFGSSGASLKIIRPDPYWSADQRSLGTILGSHAALKFTVAGARMEVPLSNRTYWSANQAELTSMRGAHGSLKFDGGRAAVHVVGQKRPYWEADQAGLKIVRGSHGSLRFDDGAVSVRVVNQKRPYWEADQRSLKVVRGSHGILNFTAEGAMVDVVKPRSLYWVADQRSLKIVWGSHARLHFMDGEANLDAVKPSSLYWNANQAGLRIIQGCHGNLSFAGEESSIHAAQPKTSYWMANQANLLVIRGSHGIMSFNNAGASVEAKTRPTLYWTSNQAKLDEIRGSHGTLRLTTEGAAIQLHSHAENKPTPRDPFAPRAAYWANQAKLEKIEGTHARLSFNNSISSSVPHTAPEDNWNSPPNLETGDFFPDSDSELEEDRPILSKRTSFGPGTFASILNRVKDRVPIVTNLVGNGSYSSFSHDEESPITPTDTSPSALDSQQLIDEPIIHASPESSHPRHQSAHFEDNPVSAIYGEEDREVKLSPLPTQVEFQFDPVYGQPIPLAPKANSPLLNRAPISTKSFESVRGLASNNPFRSAIPVRKASVTARSGRNDGTIERRRALFEGGAK